MSHHRKYLKYEMPLPLFPTDARRTRCNLVARLVARQLHRSSPGALNASLAPRVPFRPHASSHAQKASGSAMSQSQSCSAYFIAGTEKSRTV